MPTVDGKYIPRGIFNNNPGNIRRSRSFWQGEVGNNDEVVDDGEDSAFEVYVSPEHGIRAMARILLNYQRKYNLNTIRQLIERWAPPVENETDAYVHHVAAICCWPADAIVDLRSSPDIFVRLIKGIIRHENGKQPYSDDQIDEGLSMALA